MTSKLARRAPGGPGIEPRWTHGAKVAVGTAYSTSSRVWYTLDAGCVTEVYYPTIDTPQIRDLQFLFTDGETFFHDERRNFTSEIDCITEAALGFEATNRENEGRYTVRKTILGDPYQNCLLIHTRVEAPPELLSRLKMYVLCAPHLEIGGWHNNGEILHLGDSKLLLAHKGNTWLAIGTTVPFTEAFSPKTSLRLRSSKVDMLLDSWTSCSPFQIGREPPDLGSFYDFCDRHISVHSSFLRLDDLVAAANASLMPFSPTVRSLTSN